MARSRLSYRPAMPLGVSVTGGFPEPALRPVDSARVP